MDTLHASANGAHRLAFATRPILTGVAGFLLGSTLLGLSACAIREGGSDPAGGGTGVVVSVTDSSKVSLDFGNLDTLVFRDSGDFDLDKLREKLDDKDIDLESIRIIGLVVTYADSTKQFLTDNAGTKFILRIYVKEAVDSAKGRLTLESYVDPAKASVLNPDQVLFELNKHLFGKEEGMPYFLASIQDTSLKKMRVIAELTLLEKLKKTGKLSLNLVVDVAGKV
jgi:hypothetical protein